MTNDHINAFPPSYRKQKPAPPKYRCDTCGNDKCRRRFGACCWTHCRQWTPGQLWENAKGERSR